jgi:hypothetical protein
MIVRTDTHGIGVAPSVSEPAIAALDPVERVHAAAVASRRPRKNAQVGHR